MSVSSAVFCLYMGVLLMACGGGAAPQGSRVQASAGKPHDEQSAHQCRIIRTMIDGQPAFVVVAHERFAMVMAGDPGTWGAQCPASQRPLVFYGEASGPAAVIGASLEDVGSIAITPFSDRAYFVFFATMMMGRSSPGVIEKEDLGMVELPNGRLAWFLRAKLQAEDGTREILSGYAVLPASEDRVMIAHVSETALPGQSLPPDTQAGLANLLSLYAPSAELLKELNLH